MGALSVCVVGGGHWGLALAAAIGRAGNRALIVTRRAELTLPEGCERAELARACDEARLVIFAVPSRAAREAARQLGDHLGGHHYVVHGVRGLVGDGLETVSEVLRQETPARRVGALGGPVLEPDLLAGAPSVMVTGARFPEVNELLAEAFTSPALRLYSTHDLRGLEWASALVGCVAIAAGYARGLGVNAGLVAAFMTRSIHEAARIAVAAGGEDRTLLGLAGYGDLLAAVLEDERPEIALGRALAGGKTAADALAEARHSVEAVELVPRILAWCEQRELRTPIFRALGLGILGGHPPDTLLHQLMTMPHV
jgi:glycerol-3-phosphate dehydrogenase (NAD(P)+)